MIENTKRGKLRLNEAHNKSCSSIEFKKMFFRLEPAIAGREHKAQGVSPGVPNDLIPSP
jgi:hypothetical protein